MLSAMRSLQTLFPKMLHLTCFAHGLNRLAEFIRGQSKDANALIANVKSVFVKVLRSEYIAGLFYIQFFSFIGATAKTRIQN